MTERLGFVASASTTYNEPYHVARKFASLDYVTEGRVAWNVVTSWSEQEAFNFGLDAHVEHGMRYRRAEEFVDVVFGLWDSWEDDAFIRDKSNGRYFDPSKLHTLNHAGEILKVKGPLNVARPIQGISRDRAGRILRSGAGSRRADRRFDLHAAEDQGRCRRVLRQRQGTWSQGGARPETRCS